MVQQPHPVIQIASCKISIFKNIAYVIIQLIKFVMKVTVVKILNNRVLYSYLLVGATLTNMQRLT